MKINEGASGFQGGGGFIDRDGENLSDSSEQGCIGRITGNPEGTGIGTGWRQSARIMGVLPKPRIMESMDIVLLRL